MEYIRVLLAIYFLTALYVQDAAADTRIAFILRYRAGVDPSLTRRQLFWGYLAGYAARRLYEHSATNAHIIDTICILIGDFFIRRKR